MWVVCLNDEKYENFIKIMVIKAFYCVYRRWRVKNLVGN